MIHNASHQNQKQQKEGAGYDRGLYPGFQDFGRFRLSIPKSGKLFEMGVLGIPPSWITFATVCKTTTLAAVFLPPFDPHTI